MHIFIMGGGRVGFHLAKLLAEEDYEITVIENNAERQEQLDLALNARVIQGNGASPLLLQSLGVDDAYLFIACAGSDETNLIAAAAAKALGAQKAIARVEQRLYMDASFIYEGFLGVDFMLSPDALVAQEIANYIIYPGVLAAEDFARGRIQLRRVQVAPGTRAAGQMLRDTVLPGSGVLVGMVERQQETRIPHGDFRILPGDKVTLIGKRDAMTEALHDFQGEEPRMQRIAIMGGGNIGHWIAQSLEGKVESVKLFEVRPEKAQRLATKFTHKNISVVLRDATSRESLEQEHIDNFDIFIATTEDDERNIVASVLAREVGVKTTAAVIHHPDFAPLVTKLGIDMTVTPRSAVANSVIKIVRQQSVTTSTILGEGEVEVIEFDIGDQCPGLGKPLWEISSELPRKAIIATIIRGDNVFVPGGKDTIEQGDAVVLIAETEVRDKAQNYLQGK